MRVLLIACLLSFLSVAGVHGREASKILVGQSSAFSGSARDLGIEMRAGLQAAFAEVNDAGGVRGRAIKLLSKDDGYEPDRALQNSKVMVEEDQVFALIGQVGTPTAKAVLPLVAERGIPLFAPLTGAAVLRTPFNKNVINVRASYFQEMEQLIAYLVGYKKFSRIACFYQNDSYGFDGLKGLEKVLAKRGMSLLTSASYERNTVAVMGAVRTIQKERPQAVVMVGAYAACAEFIKLSKSKTDSDAVFASISFVGTESLKEALGKYGENVIISQVVPNPHSERLAVVQAYRKAMALYQHDVAISFNSFEGYIAGRLFAKIAESVPAALTRKSFVTAMETVGEFDLGGVVLRFGDGDHQGLDDVFLSEIYPEIQEIYFSE